jgi:hypothetical protein
MVCDRFPRRERSSPPDPLASIFPAGDKATHLFRAQEDGYLDLRLSRNSARFFRPAIDVR